MWPDPFKNRKPVSLKGTPANKYSAYLCLAIVTTFVATINLYSYTPHMQKKIDNCKKRVVETQNNREIKAFTSDPLVQGAIQRKQKEYEETPTPLGWL